MNGGLLVFCRTIVSDEVYSGCCTFGDLVFGPDAGLNFSHMGFLEYEHAQSALSYTASDRQRQFVVGQSLVETQVESFGAVAGCKLGFQRVGIHPDTHR